MVCSFFARTKFLIENVCVNVSGLFMNINALALMGSARYMPNKALSYFNCFFSQAYETWVNVSVINLISQNQR